MTGHGRNQLGRHRVGRDEDGRPLRVLSDLELEGLVVGAVEIEGELDRRPGAKVHLLVDAHGMEPARFQVGLAARGDLDPGGCLAHHHHAVVTHHDLVDLDRTAGTLLACIKVAASSAELLKVM